MPPTKQQLSTLGQRFDELVADVFKKAITKDEVKQVMDTIIAVVKQVKEEHAQSLADNTAENKAIVQEEVRRLGTEVAAFEKRMRDLLDSYRREEEAQLEVKLNELAAEVGYVESLIKNYDDTDLRTKIEEVRASIPEIPALPEIPAPFDPSEIVDQLAEHEREIEELKKRPQSTGGFAGSRLPHVPMVDVFTGDGSNKTFYLSKEPRSLETIKGWGSDFPYIMSNGNGFDVARKVLTIDDDTDAPSLNARFVVEYYI